MYGGTLTEGVYYLTAETQYNVGVLSDAGPALFDRQTLSLKNFNTLQNPVRTQGQMEVCQLGSNCYNDSGGSVGVTPTSNQFQELEGCPEVCVGPGCGYNGSYTATVGPPASIAIVTGDPGAFASYYVFTWQHD